jgi:hypothetical protein
LLPIFGTPHKQKKLKKEKKNIKIEKC